MPRPRRCGWRTATRAVRTQQSSRRRSGARPPCAPLSLRFLVALLLIVGFVTAGPERLERLGEAWHGGESTAQTIARIDAWVTPPAYTGRAPILPTGGTAKATGTTCPCQPAAWSPSAPVAGRTSTCSRSRRPARPRSRHRRRPPPGCRRRDAIERLLTLKDRRCGHPQGRPRRRGEFSIVPDALPQIAFVGDPKITTTGALDLTYALRRLRRRRCLRQDRADCRSVDQCDRAPLYDAGAAADAAAAPRAGPS